MKLLDKSCAYTEWRTPSYILVAVQCANILVKEPTPRKGKTKSS